MPYRIFVKELERNHKKNAIWNTIDASFVSIGFACYMPAIIIVALLKNYTDNQILLNMPVFIEYLTMAIFPFIMSIYSARIKRKKPALLFFSSIQRASWIFIIISVYYFSGNSELILPLFLISFFIFSVLSGITFIFWQEFIGRTLHPEKRSSAMGIREAIGNIVGFLTSFLVIIILKEISFPNNFTILFIIVLFTSLGSLLSLFMMKEAPYEEVSKIQNMLEHWKSILLLPKEDNCFKWFSIFTLFLYGFLFVSGQYASEAINRFGGIINKDILTGVISTITLFSCAFFAFFLGKIYEKKGKLFAFLIMTILIVVQPLFAALLNNVYAYMATFLLSGSLIAVFILEFTTLLSFAPPEKVNKYIAFISILKIIPIILYTNLGGYLTNTFSPNLTFFIAALFGVFAIIILLLRLAPYWKIHNRTASYE